MCIKQKLVQCEQIVWSRRIYMEILHCDCIFRIKRNLSNTETERNFQRNSVNRKSQCQPLHSGKMLFWFQPRNWKQLHKFLLPFSSDPRHIAEEGGGSMCPDLPHLSPSKYVFTFFSETDWTSLKTICCLYKSYLWAIFLFFFSLLCNCARNKK